MDLVTFTEETLNGKLHFLYSKHYFVNTKFWKLHPNSHWLFYNETQNFENVPNGHLFFLEGNTKFNSLFISNLVSFINSEFLKI